MTIFVYLVVGPPLWWGLVHVHTVLCTLGNPAQAQCRWNEGRRRDPTSSWKQGRIQRGQGGHAPPIVDWVDFLTKKRLCWDCFLSTRSVLWSGPQICQKWVGVRGSAMATSLRGSTAKLGQRRLGEVSRRALSSIYQGWAWDVKARNRDETLKFRDETETRRFYLSRRDQDVKVQVLLISKTGLDVIFHVHCFSVLLLWWATVAHTA